MAAALVEALTAEAEGAPKQVLMTFMAHVAERQDTVIECCGAFRVKAHSSDEMPAPQRKAKVTMTFNALGVIKSVGGAGMLDEDRPNVESERSREGSGSRTEDSAGASGGEAAARPAACSAEVIERLGVLARHSLIAAKMLARAERNQQLSRDGAAP